MKKLAALVLALTIMILGLSACCSNESNTETISPPESNTETKSLHAQGLEVVQLMHEVTKNEEYVNILIGGDSKIKTIIQDISTGNYSSPKAVFAISVSDDNLAAMANLNSLENASEELKTILINRVFGSLITRINSMSGTEKLAAASVCAVGKTFVNESATDNIIYLYTYENALPVAVMFTVGEDHAVSASGVYVLYEGFTCGSTNEIKAFFGEVTVEVTEVHPE